MENKQLSVKRIRAMMLEHNINIDQMAEKLTMSSDTLRQKLSGNRNFTLKDVINIQAISEKPFDYFFVDD